MPKPNKKAPDFSEAFSLSSLTGQFSNRFVEDLKILKVYND